MANGAASEADNGSVELVRLADSSVRLDAVIAKLIETQWLGETEAHARPARACIFELFGLRPPQVAEGAPAPAQRNRADDDTYKALVGEMGY